MRAFSKYELKRWSALMLSVLLAFEPVAYAQYEGPATSLSANAPTPAQNAFSQRELDQMLAPIALYPDALLSQILMAATYPLEVVEAARWSRDNPNLRGDDAVRTVQQRDWDPSVKSLVAFPQILQLMDEKLDWTERLGDAFLAQEAQVMDTVQSLRQKAYAAGNLNSNDRIRVAQEERIIVVEPVSPDVIYVPYYDPMVVYGLWWWPDYPPVYWGPWPGYYFGIGFAPGFAWGLGITIATGFFFGDCDWHHHRVIVANVNNYYYPRHVRVVTNVGGGATNIRSVNTAPGVWQHNPDHRRGVPYREAVLHQQFGRTSATPEERRSFRGYDQSSIGNRSVPAGSQNVSGSATVLTNIPEARSLPEARGIPETRGGPGTRSSPETRSLPETRGGTGGSPRTRAAEARPDAGSVPARRSDERSFQPIPSAPRVVSTPTVEFRPHALEDIGRGADVRNYSSRGRASNEGTVRSQSSVSEQRPSSNVSTQRPAEGQSVPRPSGNASGGGGMQHRR